MRIIKNEAAPASDQLHQAASFPKNFFGVLQYAKLINKPQRQARKKPCEQNDGNIYEIPNYTVETDAENPQFLFAGIPTKLLLHCANGTLDLQAIAKQQLANRGLDENGKWVGFKLQ